MPTNLWQRVLLYLMWTLAGGTDTGRENTDAKSRNEGKRRKKEIKRVRDGKEEW